MKRVFSERDEGNDNQGNQTVGVLARQRLLANQLSWSSKSQPECNIHSPAELTSSGSPPTAKGIAGCDTVKIKSLAEEVVTIARSRMGLPKPLQVQNPPEKEEQNVQKPRNHTRPTSMKRKLLAGLTKTSSASTAHGHDSGARYARVEVEDFWRNLRSWDLCNDLQVYMKQQLPIAKTDCPPLSCPQLPTPLPDSYDSYSEYVNAWAPLCLQEARAQLLADIFSDLQHQQHQKRNFFCVSVLGEPLRMDIGSYTDYVRLQFKLPKEEKPQQLRQNSMNDINTISFKPNDLVLIAKNLNALNQILSASRNEQTMGLIGTCENFKSGTPEGLVVKVSRKLWVAKYSCEESSSDLSSHQQYQELYLVPLKAKNVTSLREFQALCRVKDVPLLPILLAGKEDGAPNTSIEHENRKKNKAELLEEMGGVNALGKGFASYAEQKFNESQLEAVSAASKDYGKGGFTLVKGPPG